MSVRPRMYQMIAIDIKKVPSAKEWLIKFRKNLDDISFLSLAKDVFYQVDDDQEFIEECIKGYEDVEAFEIVQIFERGDSELVGLLPVFLNDENSLYAHDLLYTMVEAKLIGEHQAICIPYQDYSEWIGKSHEELRNSNLKRSDARMIQTYQGKWGRVYPNHSIDWFDLDFEFTKEFFKENGLEVKKEDIQRYLVVEWI